MISVPEVSVVMSVYNGASHLRASIDSILQQDGVDFEFIIVDDGSTDESPSILDEYANRDARIRLFHQENRGLTRALIRGCAEASGEFIARQDVGDISLPGRLERQVALVRKNPLAVLISCATRMTGPRGEFLEIVVQDPSQATDSLQTLDIKKLRGPSHHGATLFRRADYQSVGGYRPQFRMAQDIDLWVRLCERGAHLPSADVDYEAEYSLVGISSGRWQQQLKIGALILESARLRRLGQTDTEVLTNAEKISSLKHSSDSKERAAAAYFIGCCLAKNKRGQGAAYFKRALHDNPLHLKALLSLLLK